MGTSFVRKCLSILYDILTAIVSILDFITDLLVLLQYRNEGRMSFFYASLIILIVAQLSYSMAFWFRFNSSFDSVAVVLIVFCCSLLIAPVLSFVFYLIGNDDSQLYQYLDRLFSGTTFHHSNNTSNKNQNKKQTALRQWVEDKLMKHIGFIIEALIEAFPQSILQLIAIVSANNDSNNYISMFSILLSILSISTKSFILSVLVSYNWKSAVFNWISCITDIFAVFFIVSFAFYVPTNLNENDTNPFNVLQQIWLYSILITIVPFVVCSSIGWTVKQTSTLGTGEYGWCIVIQIIWLIGMCLFCMLFSIGCFVFIAAALYFVGVRHRIGNMVRMKVFYLKFISFISSAKRIHINDDQFSLIISKSQHGGIRACCVNQMLLNSNISSDPTLSKYLEKESLHENNKEYPFENVSLNDLKINSSKCNVTDSTMKKMIAICLELVNIVDDVVNGEWLECSRILIIFVFAPLYIVGRILNVIFIILVVCYLSLGNNIHIFTDDVPLFQTVMFVSYLAVLIIWSLSLSSVLREEYYASFILPGVNRFYVANASKYENADRKIMQYYDSIISQPVIKQYCNITFNRDIANIIMQFCGFVDTQVYNV